MKLVEFSKRFPNEEACEQYLKEQREKAGVVCKTKVLVMIESEAVPENEQKKGKKDRKSGHLKMKVILNRRTFGDRRFDRLVVAAVTYKPTFQHRLYNSKRSSNCG